jgi:hypothetical protein
LSFRGNRTIVALRFGLSSSSAERGDVRTTLAIATRTTETVLLSRAVRSYMLGTRTIGTETKLYTLFPSALRSSENIAICHKVFAMTQLAVRRFR